MKRIFFNEIVAKYELHLAVGRYLGLCGLHRMTHRPMTQLHLKLIRPTNQTWVCWTLDTINKIFLNTCSATTLSSCNRGGKRAHILCLEVAYLNPASRTSHGMRRYGDVSLFRSSR